MNMKRITGIVFLLLIAGLAPLTARAAAPAAVSPAGKYESWAPSATVLYDIESQNDLGKMPNAQAAAMVRKAFDEWAKIDTAKLPVFEETKGTDRMVKGWNGSNLGTNLGSYPTDHTPVIFDTDGSITEANASADVLAFGGALQVGGDGTIAEGFIVINGRAVDGLFDPDDPTPDDLTRAVVRAIGEMLGVGPSDLNDELIYDGNTANNTAVPVMHPLTRNGLIAGGGSALTRDDQMAASLIYPSDDIDTKLGTIQGKVLLADGTTGLQGIDVIAHKVDDPVNTAVSAISGVNFRDSFGNGVEDQSQRGFFQMKVPPGSYTLEFRALRRSLPPVGIFPLPGGRQFYQGSATAGPATPITVTVGQAATVNFIAPGTPAPAAQAVTQVKSNESTIDAQLVPLAATVAGHVSPQDSGQLTFNFGPDSNGNATNEKIANLYRLAVSVRSIVTLFLQPQPAGNKVELHLYLIHGILGGADTSRVEGVGAFSADNGAKALQVVVDPGTYFIGVSTVAKVASDYTLSVTTTPLVEPTLTPAPVLDHLVVGNVTDTGAQASWITDADTTGDALVALPRQDFGDPMASKAHQVAITGLAAGGDADLFAISQTTDGVLNNLPRVFFHTAAATAATGAAKLNVAVVGTVGEVIGTADAPQDTVLVELALQNSGGPAMNVQLTGLTASAGWKLAQPVTPPVAVGGIGSGGTAIVVVRLLRDGTGTPPLASVTGTGTFTGADGTATNFTISGP